MPPTKRKSTYDTSDPFVASDSGSPAAAQDTTSLRANKRAKPSTTSTPQIPERQKDDDGNPYWQISTARRVTVSDFKGKKMISVREYYQKDGAWLPGKKGITMTLDQYNELIKVMPQIERALVKDGEDVGRPEYERAPAGEDEEIGDDAHVKSEDDDDDAGSGANRVAGRGANGKSRRKANIEATSDEDED